MGWRFRRSNKIGPLRINYSKSGIGWSLGSKWYRFTKKAGGGTRTTIGTPIKGLSYVSDKGKRKARKPRAKTAASRVIPAGTAAAAPVFASMSSNGPAPSPSGYPGNNYNPEGSSAMPIDIGASPKDKSIALALCFFGGFFGLHQFYAGKTVKGLIYLFTLGAFGVMWIADIIRILLNKFTDSNGLTISSYEQQYIVKANSILDKFALWLDRKLFGSGSNYEITTEKTMLTALATNILGLHRVYAGQKTAAVVYWLMLLLSFRRSFIILLIWLAVDLVLIYRGKYGRLGRQREPRQFDPAAFKGLFGDKNVNGKIAALAVSLLFCVLAFAIAPAPGSIINSTKGIVSGTDAVSQAVSASDSISAADTRIVSYSEIVDTTTEMTTESTTTTTETTTTATTEPTTTTTTVPYDEVKRTIILNTNTHTYHLSAHCRGVSRMKDKNKKVVEMSIKEAKAKGYEPCSLCG